MSGTPPTCPLCAANVSPAARPRKLASVKKATVKVKGKLVESASPVDAAFVAGVICERAASITGRSVVAILCVTHLRIVRELVREIPDAIIGPKYRAAILNFGLSSVK